MSIGITVGTALAIGGIASAGASVASGLIGAHAAGKAADQQKAAADAAAAKQQPWVDAGGKSLGKLMQGFDNGTFGTPATFKAPTAAEAEATPGYQFTKDQGMRALGSAGSRSGSSLGGGQIKAAEEFATGLASNTYGDTFNRSMQTFQANLGANQQAFNQLLGVSNEGESAAVGVGNLMTQAGNAQAAGTVGGANAINGAITGATGDITQSILLNRVLGQQAPLPGQGLYTGPGGSPTTPYPGNLEIPTLPGPTLTPPAGYVTG